MMLTDPAVLIAAPFIVLAAYTVFGISGYGSSLISIPLLAHFLPLKVVVPLMVLLDFTAALTSGLKQRAEVDRTEVKSVLPGMLVGILGGVLLLRNLPGESLLVALGVFIIGFGTFSLLRRNPVRALPRFFAFPTGMLGGLLGALFGTGGPVYVVYFSSRLHDPAKLRATMSVVFTLSTGMRITMFVISGLLLDWHLLAAAVALSPLMILGTRLGQHIHVSLSRAQIAKVISVLLIASGASLIAKGLGG